MRIFAMNDDAGDSGTNGDLSALNDVKSWLEPLDFSAMSDDFLSECAQALIEHSGAPRPLANDRFIRPVALEMNRGLQRILIRNLHINYKSAHLDLGRPIANVRVLTEFPGIPVFPKGSEFSLYVPGRGMVIVEAEFKEA